MNTMRAVAVATLSVAIFGSAASAQRNTGTDILDSPVKTPNQTYEASAGVVCLLPLPSTASLYGCDTVTLSAGPVIMFAGELFNNFRVWEYDSACNPTASWSTAFPGTTMTGLAMPNADTTKYWAMDPSGTAVEFDYLVGTATGQTCPLPAIGLIGSAVIDDNQGGEILCVNDCVADVYTCIDLVTCAFICSFANADNTGAGAFGEGHGDAVFPIDCSNATLVVASGTLGEGQVSRVGQYSCDFGVDPACTDRWNIGQYSTFINGIEEFEENGDRCLQIVDNAGSNIIVLCLTPGHENCQGIDAGVNVLWVNSSQGNSDYVTLVDPAGPLSVVVQKIGTNSGKFGFQMWAGFPDASSITTLFDLGDACFDFQNTAGASVIENNFVPQLGSSNYFNSAIPAPGKAPTKLASLFQFSVDTVHLPSGSEWTLQSIHKNSLSSSSFKASLSNAVCMKIQ